MPTTNVTKILRKNEVTPNNTRPNNVDENDDEVGQKKIMFSFESLSQNVPKFPMLRAKGIGMLGNKQTCEKKGKRNYLWPGIKTTLCKRAK